MKRDTSCCGGPFLLGAVIGFEVTIVVLLALAR